MYACLHGPDAGRLAESFSPFVERVDERTAVFSITPRQLSPPLLAGLKGVSVGIAPTIEAAILAARHRTTDLGSLPVDVLAPDLAIFETFDMWGIPTLADLARLPEDELAARLGPEGVRLQQLARGVLDRPLKPWIAPTKYEAGADLEYSIDLREPLLFLIGQFVHELAGRLKSQSLAAQALRLRLNRQERVLELPFPTRDTKLLLKRIEHSLDRQAPEEPVSKVHLEMIPAAPRRVQHDLFTPAAPEPEKLELALGKIRALVGEANVGYPELLDSYRPGAGRPACFWPPLALRRFRPPLEMSKAFKNRIVRRSGPWRTSGEWWRQDSWDRDEWDVVLRDGSLYCVYRERGSERWLVDGEYD
jgi:protein ImuB